MARVRTVCRAVTEAVTQAVDHADEGGAGLVHLTAAVVDDQLIVLVADDGGDPHGPLRDAGIGRRSELIAEATDEYMISQRPTGGTLIEMRWSMVTKPLYPADSAPFSGSD